jgi:hypothetical protein
MVTLIAPLLVEAMVFARHWSGLQLLVQHPLSLDDGEPYPPLLYASLLVDIAGGPDMEHIIDNVRLSFLRGFHPETRDERLRMAYAEIAQTVDEHEKLAWLVYQFPGYRRFYLPVDRLSNALYGGAKLPFLRAMWTHLHNGKAPATHDGMSPADGLRLWRSLIGSSSPVAVYEWINTSVYPLDALYKRTDLFTHVHATEHERVCMASPSHDGKYSLMCNLHTGTPLEAIEWLHTHTGKRLTLCAVSVGSVSLAMRCGQAICPLQNGPWRARRTWGSAPNTSRR